MMEHAKARASILYGPQESSEEEEVIEKVKTPPRVLPKYFSYRMRNHKKDYKQWLKERLEELKNNYPKIDHEELKR